MRFFVCLILTKIIFALKILLKTVRGAKQKQNLDDNIKSSRGNFMANIIYITEKNNRLDFTNTYSPIVCGNSNYVLKFSLSESWQKCVKKAAFFVLEGKRFAVDFDGDECAVPMLPNADFVFVSLVSHDGDKQMVTTPIKIRLEPTVGAGDLSEFDQLASYLSRVIGSINKIESGDIAVQKSKIAENVSNPNLLINGDFKINQRGQTTYECGSSGGYCFDRWFCGAYQTLSKNVDGSINHKKSGSNINRWFLQWIEDYSYLLDKTITISMKVKNAVKGRKYKLGVYDGLEVVGENQIFLNDGEQEVFATVHIPKTFTKVGVIVYPQQDVLQEDTSIDIEWVKAELGEVATKFVPRTTAEEIALCQRYFVSFGSNSGGAYRGFLNTSNYNSESATGVAVLSMRIQPSISTSGKISILDSSGYHQVTKVSIATGSTNSVVLSFKAAGLVSGNGSVLQSENDASANIFLDAEIY